jgi:hypothetical protein
MRPLILSGSIWNSLSCRSHERFQKSFQMIESLTVQYKPIELQMLRNAWRLKISAHFTPPD